MGEYFWQDLLVARLIFNDGTEFHYDIGSKVDGFIGHLLSFGKDDTTIMLDIRLLKNALKCVRFVQANASNLESIKDGKFNSFLLYTLWNILAWEIRRSHRSRGLFQSNESFPTRNNAREKLYFAMPCGWWTDWKTIHSQRDLSLMSVQGHDAHREYGWLNTCRKCKV